MKIDNMNNDLDRMLESYFERDFGTEFTFDSDRTKSKTPYRAVAVCALAAVFALGAFAAVHFTGNTAQNISSEPVKENTLFIKAYSEDTTLSEMNETADYAKKENSDEVWLIDTRFGDEFFWEYHYMGIGPADDQAIAEGRALEGKNYPCLPQFSIQFRVLGDNIEKLSFESERGCSMNYYDYSFLNDSNLTDEEKNSIQVEMDNRQNIYNGEEVNYSEFSTVYWKMPKYALYSNEYIIPKESCFSNDPFTMERIEKAHEKLSSDLESWTPEEMTEMFGDTVTVTACYKDGTTQTKKMLIYFEDKNNFAVRFE